MGHTHHQNRYHNQMLYTPNSHSSLYPARTYNSPTTDKINHKNKANHCIPAHLQHLSELATSSYWDNEIEKQHQWNTKQPPCLKANVILRKKQTHVELARYLHVACF